MICIRKLKTCWRPSTPCCLLVAAMTLILASFIVLPHLLPQNIRYRDAVELTYRLAAHLYSPETTELTFKQANGRSHNTTQYNTTHIKWNKTTEKSINKRTAPSERTAGVKRSGGGDSKRYLIYRCDDKEYCYGLGDRQRAIVSVYLLAELTNRTFGIIMTSPSNFSEFYKPRLVNWDIPSSELEGKTFIELKVLGPQADIKLDRVDINVEYPQDVVYIRTNQKFHYSLKKNPFYKDRFPKWAQVPHWKLYQDGWMRLMTPTAELRRDLNEMLIRIVGVMEEEQRAWHTVKQTGCCAAVNNSTNGGVPVSCGAASELSNVANNTHINRTCLEQRKTTCIRNGTKCTPQCTNGTNCTTQCTNGTKCTPQCTNGTKCTPQCTNDIKCTPQCTNGTKCIPQCASVTKQCIYNCTKSLSNCTNEKCLKNTLQNDNSTCSNNGSHCVEVLRSQFKNSTDKSRVPSIARNLCSSPFSLSKQHNVSVESVRVSKGYDVQDMNLVCAHIRLGHSSSMPFETNVRNRPGEEKVVWEFLKPYVANGHHVYLASDSEQVRQKAKALFGYRLHISSIPIVHIASVQKGQDKRLGFRLALMEQLLLATSCSVLVVSYSGFSMKAAQIRHILRPEADSLFIYRAGKVVPVQIHSLQ
ncbi:unnamed protein product [Lymnaea stagnalis]|uniref:Uncharacterized protein n=1 Tax=Lymnaea stagnalis TaxID=6523 RepID=A0AAV2HDA9_LYMST